MIFAKIYLLKWNFCKFWDGKVGTATWGTKTSNNVNSCKFRVFQTIDIKVPSAYTIIFQRIVMNLYFVSEKRQ